MKILNFKKQHIEEAGRIALANYSEERQTVKELPRIYEVPALDLRRVDECALRG